MMIQHHTKYKEIDGVDEITILPSVSAHIKEHWRLRKAGRPAIPKVVAKRAGRRSPLGKRYKNNYRNEYIDYIDFEETVGENTRLRESIQYYLKTGYVSVFSWFKGNNGQTPHMIDEPCPSAREA